MTVTWAIRRNGVPQPDLTPARYLTKKIPTTRRADQEQQIFPRTRPSPMRVL
jgi:hypothetical protein